MQEDKIFDIKNTKFYLPNYPTDCISQCIVGGKDYWDKSALNIIDKYLEDNSTILDIGANVGSHSLYWAIERNAKKVYSFEPYTPTYEILDTNIKLNNLEKTIFPSNKGLSNELCNANVKSFMESNIGGTTFEKNADGEFEFVSLDSLNIAEKIDLIKIDVEGHEMEVLEGAIKTIFNNKPIIVIETFNKKEQVVQFLNSLGFALVETIREGEDYIFRYKQLVGDNV